MNDQNPPEPEEEKNLLMVSPTTGNVMMVLPNGCFLGFSDIDSVDSFACQLLEELVAVKQLLVKSNETPIGDDYSARALKEWEEILSGSPPVEKDKTGDV